MTTATATQDHEPAAHVNTRAHNRKRWESTRTYVFAALIAFWCLLPAYWMVVTAFRDVGFTYDATPFFSHITLDNFRAAFSTDTGNHLARALVNSLIVGIITTFISLMFGIFASYALARLNFRAKYLVLGFILAASMFPGVALVTPLFQLFTDLNWIGTYQALIIPYISFALPLTIYILVSFFREMPWELEEAARIDGCSKTQAFRKIIMPLAAPGVFTTAILAFITSWNEFLIASQLSNQQTQTVTVAIASFTGSQPHQEPYTAVMAAATIVTIPLVIMVLVFQKQIVAGLTAGAVK
jgi:multiple sugar transport system permease protein